MYQKQLKYIRTKTDAIPEIALVLGSGLGAVAEEMEITDMIDYRDIPGFPVSTAPGHKGRLLFGTAGGRSLAVMQGRFHLYEGYSPRQIADPVRLIKLMGAKILFLTNAAGGINPHFSAGDFMIISDHIASFVPSPLTGKNDNTIGTRFPDMSEVYSKRLCGIIEQTAAEHHITVKKGTYLQFAGPAFETPAEIRMAAAFGADAVGMSTAIEAQAARHCGLEVCGVSLISNLACGILETPLSAEEVEKTARRTAPVFNKLILKSIEHM